MNVTFAIVCGSEALAQRIADCWASVFCPGVVAYRAARGSAGEPAIAVVVEVMVAAQRSGVAFTADPAIGRRDVVVVEAALGQGALVVSGAVEPDIYQLSARGPCLSRRSGIRPTRSSEARTRRPHRAARPERVDTRLLSDDEAADIAWLALGAGTAAFRRSARRRVGNDGRRLWLDLPAQGAILQQGSARRADDEPGLAPDDRRAAALATNSGGTTCPRGDRGQRVRRAVRGLDHAPPQRMQRSEIAEIPSAVWTTGLIVPKRWRCSVGHAHATCPMPGPGRRFSVLGSA
jgi:pyruvate,water dikinase